MKNPFHLVVPLLSFALLSACSKPAEPSSAQPSASAEPVVVADSSLPELKVQVTANDQMKFDVLTIEAKPGQKVTLTLKNAGTMPKMSMGHNLVLLSNDVEAATFIEASQTHMGSDYIAPELRTKVIAHTKLLGPGESDTISFAAPRKAGAYTYLCSFPGHFTIGMKGVLTVK